MCEYVSIYSWMYFYVHGVANFQATEEKVNVHTQGLPEHQHLRSESYMGLPVVCRHFI